MRAISSWIRSFKTQLFYEQLWYVIYSVTNGLIKTQQKRTTVQFMNVYSRTVWTSSTETSAQWRIKYCTTSRRNAAIIDALQILHDFLSSCIGSSNPESFCLLSRVAPCLESDTKSSETPDKALVKPWSLTKPWLNGAWLKALSLPSSVNVGPAWLLTDRCSAAGEVWPHSLLLHQFLWAKSSHFNREFCQRSLKEH